MATRFENGHGKNTTFVLPDSGHFKQQACGFHMIKEDYPKNSIMYISQGFLTIKDNKIFYYDDHYLFGEINKCINPPEDIHNCICKEI